MQQNDFSSEEHVKKEEENQETPKNKEEQQDESSDQGQELESAQLEIENLKNKLEEIEQRNLRLQADFENYRKRVSKEKEDIYRYASQGLIENLLPVLDNFERALDSIKGGKDENQGYFQGIEMVYHQLIQVLSKEGVEEIPALGEIFDPNVHHAVAQESNDEFEDQCIIEVFQKGYRLKDRVIRPSMVKVCIHS